MNIFEEDIDLDPEITNNLFTKDMQAHHEGRRATPKLEL